MKRIPKAIIVWLLGSQVRRLLAKQSVTVIGVAGSIGKTSTKFAITQLLGASFRVRSQEGNYNDIVTVPLVFFGHQNPPNLLNPLAWLRIFLANERTIRGSFPYDVVVVELGTDGPGQLADFQKYLHLDIAVLTAIAPEHMEYFGTLEAVATEELSVASFANAVIANLDLTAQYIDKLDNVTTYGFNEANYQIIRRSFGGDHFSGTVTKEGRALLKAVVDGYAESILYSVLAAIACADHLGLEVSAIQKGIEAVKPAPGRMQPLRGIEDTLLLDDSYNASPEAVLAALDALYSIECPQRIALLGNMNELGDHSAAAHTQVGEHCDPKKLDLVLTLGPDANAYTAPAASKKGCMVKTFDSPYAAGRFIAEQLHNNAVVLVKGSQNGVFAEESLKFLLANNADRSKLVRQSTAWLAKKKAQFADYEG